MEPLPLLLQKGLEPLAHFGAYHQIGISYRKQLNRWVLHFSLQLSLGKNAYMPPKTQWFALINPLYPYGDIDLYPDRVSGIRHTFQHQSYNEDTGEQSWRTGNICVRTTLGSWEQRGFDKEPRTAPIRLAWHIERAIAWLQAAATNRLAIYGDPYELPAIRYQKTNLVVFQETPESFEQWKDCTTRIGTFKAGSLSNSKRVMVITEFDKGDEGVYPLQWGQHFSGVRDNILGLWILVNDTPVLNPWQIPVNWKEMAEVGRKLQTPINEMLQDIFEKSIPNNPGLLLVGFPVPEKIGQLPVRIFWLAAFVPNMPYIKGFIPNSQGYKKHSVKTVFAGGAKIQWVNSENWAKDQITRRGQLEDTVMEHQFLLIGAGAVGSLVADLLVRLGIIKLTVLDKEILNVGNFSRHTLTLKEIDQSKAEAVVARVNAIFPHVQADAVPKSVQAKVQETPLFLQQFNIIIDATGSDEVIQLLNDQLKEDQVVISLSLGLNSNRLFAFFSGGGQQLKEDFDTKLEPWLNREVAEKGEVEMPMEGIGCWHPLFPARYDAIMLLVSASIGLLETYIHENKKGAELVVIEKTYDADKVFTGIKVIRENAV